VLLSQEVGEAGMRWFQGLREAVASLAHSPQDCPLAPENAMFPFEVRQLLYAYKAACVPHSLYHRGSRYGFCVHIRH